MSITRKISVIVPTYKPKEYLWECLSSLCAQTLSPNQFEILLILNGCCEPWKGTIEAYITSNMQGINIKLMQTDLPGVSNARNFGLDRAQGEYIAFVDDDDYVSPCYLEELLYKSSQDTVAICYPFAFNDGQSGVQLPYAMTLLYKKIAPRGRQRLMKGKSFFSGPCMKLFHRSIIRNVRFDNKLKVGEDTTFMFVISDCIKFIDFTTRDSVYYRRFRQGSAVTTKRTFKERFNSNMYQLRSYISSFIKNPFKYNFLFFLTRCGGCVKGVFVQ